MASISTAIKMQDRATSTLKKVSANMDKITTKADQISDITLSEANIGNPKISPQLVKASQSYQDLIAKQETINARIEEMSQKEKNLKAQINELTSGYRNNDSAVAKVQQKLNKVTGTKDRLIKQSDKITREIENQANNVVKVNDNTKKSNGLLSKLIKTQSKLSSGFSQMGAGIVVLNQALQLTQQIVRTIGSFLDYTDNLTLTQARVDMINDGLQTTEELQNKIYAAAERSRGSYADMAKTVGKLGMLAGDAFKNNDELVAFTELLNKSFVVSGASDTEISSAMYQLTQAMSSGMLQGDELRTIRENAPMFYEAIAKYTGKSKAELKEMGAEGEITADIMKKALFTAADDINAKFEKMPMTFSQAMTSVKNSITKAFQPVANRISEIVNSEQFAKITEGITVAAIAVANAILWVIDKMEDLYNWVQENWPTIQTVIGGVLWYITTALLVQAAAWVLANWKMLAMIGIFVVAYSIFQSTGDILTTLAWVILAVATAIGIWQLAQWVLNGALYACPIVWIIVLVIALIAVIYLIASVIAKMTGVASSGLGVIAGAINVVIQWFKNMGLTVANIAIAIANAMAAIGSNIATAFGNAIKSVQSWFYGLLKTGTEVILGIVKLLNKLPFVDIDTKGLTSAAKKYADKKAAAENSKKEYKDVSEEFNKGLKTFDTFGKNWVQNAFNEGAAWGDNLANDITEGMGQFDPNNMIKDLMDDANEQAKKMQEQTQNQGEYDFGSFLDGSNNLPVSVEKDKTGEKEVDISDEDLQMLKDIASKEYMVNYKQITPNVNIQFGDVKETADVNKIQSALKKMMEEELAELYVAEEA